MIAFLLLLPLDCWPEVESCIDAAIVRHDACTAPCRASYDRERDECVRQNGGCQGRQDLRAFERCLTGPAPATFYFVRYVGGRPTWSRAGFPLECEWFADKDNDGDVDLRDWSMML